MEDLLSSGTFSKTVATSASTFFMYAEVNGASPLGSESMSMSSVLASVAFVGVLVATGAAAFVGVLATAAESQTSDDGAAVLARFVLREVSVTSVLSDEVLIGISILIFCTVGPCLSLIATGYS